MGFIAALGRYQRLCNPATALKLSPPSLLPPVDRLGCRYRCPWFKQEIGDEILMIQLLYCNRIEVWFHNMFCTAALRFRGLTFRVGGSPFEIQTNHQFLIFEPTTNLAETHRTIDFSVSGSVSHLQRFEALGFGRKVTVRNFLR